MDPFLTNTMYGVSYGLLYALMGVSLAVVYRAARVLNFAQGDIVTLGGFLVYAAAISAGTPILAAAAIGVAGTVVVGLIFSAAIVPMVGRQTKSGSRIKGIYNDDAIVNIAVGTLGISLVIEASEQLIWGVNPLTVGQVIDIPQVRLGGVVIAGSTILDIGVSVMVLALLGAVFTRTKIGRWMTATFDNPVAASLVGIDIRHVYLVAWAISGAIAGVAAVLLVPLIYLSPTSIESFMFVAFAAAVVGGFDNFVGIVIGGCLFGLLDAYVAAYLSTQWEAVLVLGLMVFTLMVRPTGFVPSKRSSVVRV